MGAAVWLTIAALWAVAVAQPLLDLLGANPEFFVAHRAGAADVLALTLVLAVVLPACLALTVRLIGRAWPRAQAFAFNAVVGALAATMAMQLAVRGGASTWLIALSIAAVAAAAVVFAHRRWAPVRSFFAVLGVAAIVVPVVFLLKPGIRSLVAGQTSAVLSAEVASPANEAVVPTPVVLVIFDELPLVSLLDASHNIDPVLYPHLTALAGDGVWYRNATTVDDFTRFAVPAIVTGKYPRTVALPSAVDHPNTLFTLLGRTHRLEVSEAVTGLCPQKLCPTGTETSHASRLASMARDLRVVFLHLVLTEDLTRDLPDPTETWAGFDGGDRVADVEGAEEASRAASADDKAIADAAQQRWRQGVEASRVTPVLQFIEGIGKDDPQPTFYFIHTLISHQPHHMLPGGRQNKTWVSLPARTGWNRAKSWAVGQMYQRHLLQVGFVDNLVGQLTARLKEAGVYEQALIVITSDHGISYLPNAPQRTYVRQTAAEIMRVPLIIKFPNRISVSSHVSDMNVEAVDIVPTVADALGVDLPWEVDGTSLLDPARPARPSKAIFSGAKRRRHDVLATGPNVDAALRRKLDLFGDLTRNTQRAPRVPAFDALLGQPLAALRVSDGGGRVEIASAWDYEHVDLAAPAVVFDVAGRFASPRPDTFVAVAVNGVVEAVTRTWESNARGWQATPRFDVWRPGRNTIDVLVIDRDEAGLLLRRADLGQVRPADLNLISASAADEWGVSQGGFYAIEGAAEAQFRWTRDRAALSSLFTHEPPREVQVDVLTVPDGTPKMLKIEANDCVLFEGMVGNGWSSALSLERCDISRDGLTLSFTTDAPRGKTDPRRRGVALSRVVLR